VRTTLRDDHRVRSPKAYAPLALIAVPGCLRVIHFEPGAPAAHPGLKKNPRGKYKTRIDREFCKGRGCKQKYHYRRKAGWPGYH
jgi:hypothetical protein